jgi:hypothetical protein
MSHAMNCPLCNQLLIYSELSKAWVCKQKYPGTNLYHYDCDDLVNRESFSVNGMTFFVKKDVGSSIYNGFTMKHILSLSGYVISPTNINWDKIHTLILFS